MSLNDGLEKLLRAAYEAGAKGDSSAKTGLEQTLARIEKMDATQPNVYGQAAKDFLTHVRNSLGRCPKCGHAPHGNWCANMASDNDCSCTYDPAAEWIDTIEMGDRLSAIADLADATERELPSLHGIGTPVHFKEGDFYIQAVSRNRDGTTVDLVDASRYLENRTYAPQAAPPLLHYGSQGNGGPTGCGAVGPSTTAPDRVTCGPCSDLAIGAAMKPPINQRGPAGPRKVNDCEECHNKVDDPDIDKLGYDRFGRHLCVKDYLDEARRRSESWPEG